TDGEFYTYQPRDVTISGLSIEIESIDDVAEAVRKKSFHSVWRQSVVTSVTGQQLGSGDGRRGGLVSVDIPLPMPKQLESIFGPGENTHINISGREEITFAGESRKVDPFIGVEGQQKQSLFPSLDMEQKLDVTLSGTIGDKVFIQVDHSSQPLMDKGNNIQLWYEGYEDDIIKRIDLGNTSLSLTGSNLVNFSTASTGLFGVKMLAEIGATEFTVIASKQEGETSGASFSPTGGGGIGQTEERVIQDINYIKNKYFYFDNPFVVDISSVRPRNDDPNIFIEIWREIRPDQKSDPTVEWEPSYAFLDLDGTGDNLRAGRAAIEQGVPEDQWPVHLTTDFERLTENEDYNLIFDFDDKSAVVGFELIQPVAEDKALAVSYVTTIGDTVGGAALGKIPAGPGPAERDTVVLELVKPKVPRPNNEYGFTWYYMMRNFYNLGLSNIEPASFELEIRDRRQGLDTSSPEGSTIPYIRIFGLDQFDAAGRPGFDDRFDVLRTDILNTRTGVLQFPYPFAFAPDTNLVKVWTDSLFNFGDPDYLPQWQKSLRMYTEYLTNPYFDASQYDIVVRAVSTTKSFRLDALNIVENSERVTLDGRPLSRGTDYSINYDTGEVELKGDALNQLNPTSKLNIDYEFTPFGGSASSSLVGFSTQSKFSQNARLGTIFLYESKGTALDKPRLGEEPTRAIVGGINGQFQHNSKFLTGLANLFPLVDTDAVSTITVSGEVAGSIPDPNTKGEAYIEDFEGIEDSDRFTTSRRTWKPASPPVDPTDFGLELSPDSMQSFIWYNIEPDQGGAHKRDFNPDLNERENTLVSTLDLEVDDIPRAPERNWVGVMTGFGSGGLDLSRGQYLELWINDFKPNEADRGGLLRIDMGRIDEDFFEPEKNQPDFEDQERDGWLATYDDTGLDGKFNGVPENLPTGIVREPESDDPNVDANGDDYNPARINGRFIYINGTEKNQVDDSEDLDRSGQVEQSNSYFSYVIDLSDTAVVDIRETYPNYDGFARDLHKNDSWRLYRVKLSDATIVAPDGIEPRLDEIRHVRIWIDDVEQVFQDADPVGSRRFQLAEMKVVGNRWELDGVRDLADTLITDPNNPTEFTIGGISTKTDPTRYNPPIIPREENGVYDKEQSMFLKFDSLLAGTQIRIFKQFIGKGLDLTSYREINFWVHADQSIFHNDLEYYFRLAFDENNFYEIKFPVTADYFDPVSGWMYGLIQLEDLTSLKIAQSDSVYDVSGTIRDQVEKNRVYDVRVVRKPNLFDVRFIYAGVRNVSQTGMMFEDGEIWLNDIYSGDVRRDIGIAQRLSGTVNIGGGVLSLGGSWQRTDEDFRGLRQRRGSGVQAESYAINAKTNLKHFIPLFGFSVPVAGNFSRTTTTPQFLPAGDTEISDPDLRDSLRTETVARSFSTSLGKKGSQNPLFKYTIDKMTTNFSFSETMLRTPTARDTSRTMTGSLRYQINWTNTREIPLIRGARFRYWFNALNFNVNASRSTKTSYRFRNGQFVKQPAFYDADVRMNGSVNYSPFRSLSSSFQGSMVRDMNQPHFLWGFDIGREISRGHGMNVTYKPPPIFLISAFSPDISLNTNYNEDSGPNVRRADDPEGTLNASNSRNAGVKLRFDLGHYFKKL
ncbi:MAG: cell surface protein SprA, partial [Candidatus Latescibacterota bacterium]